VCANDSYNAVAAVAAMAAVVAMAAVTAMAAVLQLGKQTFAQGNTK